MRVRVNQKLVEFLSSTSRGPVHDITALANEASDVMGSGWRRLTVYQQKKVKFQAVAIRLLQVYRCLQVNVTTCDHQDDFCQHSNDPFYRVICLLYQQCVFVSTLGSFRKYRISITGYPGSPVVALDFLARHRSTLSEQRAVLFEAARSNVQRLCRLAASWAQDCCRYG